MDALGYVWYYDRLYNGFDPETTKSGLERCSVEPIADHGMIGRGVLLDVARHRGVDCLERDAEVGFNELRACADRQGVENRSLDVLCLLTGWLEWFYEGEREPILEFDGLGITYTEEFVEWFHQKEISVFVPDTLANERTYPDSSIRLPLHAMFIRD